MTPRDDRPFLTRLFEPASIEEQAPIARVLTYALLALWSLVVLIPLYWVFITSFKGRGRGRQRPLLPPLRRLPAEPERLALHAASRTTPSAPT